jgi:hypothetical protein
VGHIFARPYTLTLEEVGRLTRDRLIPHPSPTAVSRLFMFQLRPVAFPPTHLIYLPAAIHIYTTSLLRPLD